MRKFTKFIAVAALSICCVACNEDPTENAENGGNSTDDTIVDGSTDSTVEAKYIFYFIGDGMGATQINLAEAAYYNDNFKSISDAAYATRSGSVGIGELNIRQMPVVGLQTTHADDRYITDSAAAATALASGVKTYVNSIGMDVDMVTPVTTISELAKAKGMKVGVVSSVSIDHATPACFYAHDADRNSYEAISAQLITSGFDYFAGGSSRWNKGSVGTSAYYTAYRAEAEANGFKYVSSRAEFEALNSTSGPVIATISRLADEQYTGDGSALPYAVDVAHGRGGYDTYEDAISLADFTAKGAEVLLNDNGFFMMIESGKIDWACHANDAVTTAYEMMAFDAAIGEAIKFAAKYPNETLIVVTGDHDTGGLTIGFSGTQYESAFELLANQTISYQEFSVFTSALSKATDNSFDAALELAKTYFGFTNDEVESSDKAAVNYMNMELSNYEVSLLSEAWNKKINGEYTEGMDAEGVYYTGFGGYCPFTVACLHVLNYKCGLDFSTYSHTAVPVPVFAMGANADIFTGYYDNTDIPLRIIEAANLK